MYCIEVDVFVQYIQYVCEFGMDIVGFLMMSYMIMLENFVKQVKLMEGYGVICIYVVDFGGVMNMSDICDCFRVLKVELKLEM